MHGSALERAAAAWWRKGWMERHTYLLPRYDDAGTFHEVCAALRDTDRNPEWRFVREGPTWHGRRVATWAELFA